MTLNAMIFAKSTILKLQTVMNDRESYQKWLFMHDSLTTV